MGLFVNLVWTYASLLSGRDLQDCQNATDPSCLGGIAMATAITRYHTNEKVIGSTVMPRLDFESSFVQMHPLEWAVNRYIFHEHFGFETYFAYRSLLSQSTIDSPISNRDLSDLQSSTFRPMIGNVAVPSLNSWSPYVQNIHFDHKTGLALIPINHSRRNLSFATQRTLSALGLLNYVARLNRELDGCRASSAQQQTPTDYQVYADSRRAAAGNSSSSNSYNGAGGEMSQKEPPTCWIPIIINEVSEQDFGFLEALSAHDNPPAMIVDVRGTYLEEYGQPTRIGDRDQTWIVSYTNVFWVHNHLSLELSDDLTTVVNVTLISQDLNEVDPAVRDEEYSADIDFLREMANDALANDPEVGSSEEMPFANNDLLGLRPCMGGECPVGNLFTDAIRWRVDADVSFVNSGGLRGDGWSKGQVRMSDIWEATPFANTVCTGEMTGLSLFQLFNYSTSLATYQSVWTRNGDRLLQLSGARVTYNTALNQSRLVSIEMWDDSTEDYVPLERLRTYKFATDSWMCSGFEPFRTMLSAAELIIPGEKPSHIGSLLVQDLVAGYLKQLAAPFNTTHQGRLVNNTEMAALDMIQTEETCPSDTYWAEKYRTCFNCPDVDQVTFEQKTLEFAGTTGVDDRSIGQMNLFNGENFTVSLVLKSSPSWLVFTEDLSMENDTYLTWWELQMLNPGETVSVEFWVSTQNLEAGTATSTVSFGVFDGGSHPGCVGLDTSFDVLIRVQRAPQLNRAGDIRIVGLSLMALAIAIAISFAGFVYCYRARKAVRAMQPPFLGAICLGVTVMLLAVVSLSIEDNAITDPGPNAACMATPWLLSMGFTIVMSALIAKLWRINKLFKNTLRRTTVTMKEALYIFGGIFSINFLLLLVWTLVDPLEWEIRQTEDEEWNQFGVCTATNTAGFVLFVVTMMFNLATLCIACQQAYKARRISTTLSESKQLGFALFSWVQIVLVGVPVLFLIEDDNPNAQYFLQVVVIVAGCISMLLFVFVPIIVASLKSESDNSPAVRISGVTTTRSNVSFREGEGASSRTLGHRGLSQEK